MTEPQTLKKWRELRGFTVEELADAIGEDPERIERWEAVGWDGAVYTRERDAETKVVLGALFGVLGIEAGIVGVHAPSSGAGRSPAG